MVGNKQIAISDGLFTCSGEEPSLLGSQCATCSEHFFPRQNACSKCSGTVMRDVNLGALGTLWSWTIQCFPPKAPYRSDRSAEEFKPYGVGYVELACGLKVEARLLESDPQKLRIGEAMRLAIVPFYHDDAGREVLSFAFRRAAHSNSDRAMNQPGPSERRAITERQSSYE